MKTQRRHQSNPSKPADSTASLHSELLILPDGQILVHNLTTAFAELLRVLNPQAETIVRRCQIENHATPPTTHELSN